jgi:phage I-like protein
MDFDDALTRLDEAKAEALRTAVGEAAPNMVMAKGLSEDGEAPEWIQLTTGRTFEGRDGRKFKVQSARAIVKAFDDAGEHLQVDIDHESEFAHPMMSTSTKSYGWVTGLAVRNQGQLWARVEWTAEGRALITEKQFRSISPVF